MVTGRKLKTQTEGFWRDEYEVSEDDVDDIISLVLKLSRPQPLGTLASAIIARRFQLERDALAREAERGRIYRPMDQHEVSETLIFSGLDFSEGRVVEIRPGHNPKYEPFAVIRVSFGEDALEREFASIFPYEHALNRPVEELTSGVGPEITEEDMDRLFSPYVASRLDAALMALEDWAPFSGLWFLRELLPDVHVGHLNLAEAVIYERGHPVTAREMLGELDLEMTSSPEAQLFALNHALGEDLRFDNLGRGDEQVWYLRALEPQAVLQKPAVLKPAFRALGKEYIGLTMLDMVEEIGDELDDVEGMTSKEASEIRCEMTFPHLYAGTLPATHAFMGMLSSAYGRHFPVAMLDAQSGQRFDVWVVPEEHYVCGFGDWYASVGMCIGGQLSVTPEEEPLTFRLSVAPARSRRSQWDRAASVEDGRLILQMQRGSVPLRCDRNMLVSVTDREAIAHLMGQSEAAQLPLRDLIRLVFGELAKLSGRGLAHAKSVYSVANMYRRTGAVPVFTALTQSACYDPVGDGFWAYDASLDGTHYRTPEDMRERPLSSREDLIRDQVVQYPGR